MYVQFHQNYLLSPELSNDEKVLLFHLLESTPHDDDISILDLTGLSLRMRLNYKQTLSMINKLVSAGYIKKRYYYEQRGSQRLTRYQVIRKPPRAGGG